MVPVSCGCWIWCGGDFSYGYGAFSYNNQNRPAHRISWFLYRGEIPKGMMVCHRCDQPLCVNPEHLFLGTQRDNMADKVRKGRQARGESHGMSKLTDWEVMQIKGVKGFRTAKDIASEFGITPERVWQIWGPR